MKYSRVHPVRYITVVPFRGAFAMEAHTHNVNVQTRGGLQLNRLLEVQL